MGSNPVLRFRAHPSIEQTVAWLAEQRGTSESQVLREFIELSLWLSLPDTTVGDVLADDVVEELPVDEDTAFRAVVDSDISELGVSQEDRRERD